MKRWNRWAALLLVALLCLSLLAGCGEKKESLSLTACLGADVQTLDPAYVTEERDITVVEQLYENLMRVTGDVSGSPTVTNGLARSYEEKTNYDGTVTYTFHLRGAKWSDGVSVKADDFVYAWQRLADPRSQSPNAELLSVVKGYDTVRSGGDISELSVTAKNDSTLVVTLTGQCPWFLTDICTAAATMPLRKDVVKRLKEAAQTQNDKLKEEGIDSSLTWSSDVVKLVTDGAYRVGAYTKGEYLLIARNDRYYGRESGPDNIKFLFAATPEDAWALYDAGTVDFVASLPEEQLKKLAKDANWKAEPDLATYTVLFNGAQAPFDDPKVRQAFSLSIDRNALSALAGVTAVPAEGLVPVGVAGGDDGDFRTGGGALIDNSAEDYADNCAEALSLLNQSGYTGGASFPRVEYLYVDRGTNAAEAQALTQTWNSVLHIKVTAKAVSETELETALSEGSYALAGQEVRGYADDAESFLSAWTSKNERNVIRYANSAYDTLMAVIDSASDVSGRLGCLHDAESLLLSEGSLAPLYSVGTAWKLNPAYSGVCRDARGWFCFGNISRVSGT